MGDTSELMKGFGCCRSSFSALGDDGKWSIASAERLKG